MISLRFLSVATLFGIAVILGFGYGNQKSLVNCDGYGTYCAYQKYGVNYDLKPAPLKHDAMLKAKRRSEELLYEITNTPPKVNTFASNN